MLPPPSFATLSLVTVNSMVAIHKFKPLTLSPSNCCWQLDDQSIVFGVGSRKLLFNDCIFWLNSPATTNSLGILSIAKVDADTILDPLLNPEKALQDYAGKVIVLDPGHGGKDPGAPGCSKLREKAVVLDIARRVRRKLRQKHLTVYLTRDRDAFVELKDRPAFATRHKADIFVSIHANQAGREGAAGVETYVMPAAGYCSTTSTKPENKSYPGNRNDAANTALARYIHCDLLAQTKAKDRGVKRARFVVLKYAKCPAALVEVGFITNKHESQNIIDPQYRDKIAAGLAKGILDYISHCKKNNLAQK